MSVMVTARRPGIRRFQHKLRGRQPRGAGDRAATRRPTRSNPATGRPHMLRLQAPLPDDYTLAADADLVDRIAAAKECLGDRLLILGHHYQRDEVIRWADSV